MEIVVLWEENRDLEWTDLLTDYTPVTTLSMKNRIHYCLFTHREQQESVKELFTHILVFLLKQHLMPHTVLICTRVMCFFGIRMLVGRWDPFCSVSFTEWKYDGSLEGSPDHPNPGRLWKLVEDHKLPILAFLQP